jgi:hypothetical protein
MTGPVGTGLAAVAWYPRQLGGTCTSDPFRVMDSAALPGLVLDEWSGVPTSGKRSYHPWIRPTRCTVRGRHSSRSCRAVAAADE